MTVELIKKFAHAFGIDVTHSDDELEQHLQKEKSQHLVNGLTATLWLSDNIDHLVSFFGIGKFPSGDKDPFKLRRAAYKVIESLEILAMPIDETFTPEPGEEPSGSVTFLRHLITASVELHKSQGREFPEENIAKLLPYIEKRRAVTMKERQNKIKENNETR
jgi:glycyl-tRNA synthetase beta subunit